MHRERHKHATTPLIHPLLDGYLKAWFDITIIFLELLSSLNSLKTAFKKL